MKKLLLFILNFCFVAAMGQNLIAPITISLPANPPANTADWATAMPPVMITAQGKSQNGQLPWQIVEGTILVTIKSGGAKICGSYTQQTAPASNFNSTTKTWSGAAVLSLLGQECILKPGTYELCVQFYYRNPATNAAGLAGEACKSFTIADTKQQNFSPPQNIMPQDEKIFTEQEASMPIMLRWTPVLPKPKADVNYKVRVIEILPGQNKTEALRNNAPIDIQEVKNQTQTNTKLSKRCNNCEYVWNVEASKRSAMGDIEMLGTSEATSFSVKPGNQNPEKFNPPVNQLPVDGKVFTEKEAAQPIVLRWIPVLPKPKADVIYKVKVWDIPIRQSRAQAIKNNKPIEILEVKNETQATLKLAQRCNNCEYVWNVEASKKSQMGDIEMLGTSEATGFSVATANCVMSPTLVETTCIGTTATSRTIRVKIKIENTSSGSNPATIYMNHANTFTHPLLLSMGLNAGNLIQGKDQYFVASPGVNTVIPANPLIYPSTISSGNFVMQEVDVNINNSITSFKILVITTSKGNNSGDALVPCYQDVLVDNIPPCRCNLCDNITFNLGQEATQFNPWGTFPFWFGDNNHLYLTQPLVVGPSSIKVLQVKAEVADFYWYTEKEDCKKCDNNSYYWGNLISGNTNNIGFNPSGTSGTDDGGVPLPNSHEMQFISNTPAGSTFNGNIRLQMSVPPQTELSCCTDCFRFCIRYTIVFLENGVCKTCIKIKCYEVKRQHRPSIFILYPPPNECGDPGIIIHHGGGLLQTQPKNN